MRRSGSRNLPSPKLNSRSHNISNSWLVEHPIFGQRLSSGVKQVLSWGSRQSKCFYSRWDCLEHIFSCQYQGRVSQTFECVCITILYEHTWAYYELILQWKVDKLQPESPLAWIVSSVERFTGSMSELLDCKQNCYFHHSAGFSWNQLYALRILFVLSVVANHNVCTTLLYTP